MTSDISNLGGLLLLVLSSQLIRNPIGDLAPVLLALGAELELRSAAGSRVVGIDVFFLDYRKTALKSGEILASMTRTVRVKEHSSIAEPSSSSRACFPDLGQLGCRSRR